MSRPKFLPPVSGYDEDYAEPAIAPPGQALQQPPAGVPPVSPQDPSEGDFSNQLDAAIEAHDQAMSSGKPPPDAAGVAEYAKTRAAAPPPVDFEAQDRDAIAQGAERDRMSNLVRGIETAGHQLTAGVLQQPHVAESVSQPTNYEATARATAERNDAKRYGRAKDAEAMGVKRKELTLEEQKQRLAAAHQEWQQKSEAEKEKYKREHDGATLAEDVRNHDMQNARGLNDSTARLELARATLENTKGHQASEDESSLRKEVTGNQATKDLSLVNTMAEKAKAAAKDPSAAGDISLIYAYMKLLDPNSSVRESEYASAQNAGGIPEKVWSSFNRLKDGERLSPPQRADFLNQVDKLVQANKSAAAEVSNRYRGIAQQKGINPDFVAPKIEPTITKGAVVRNPKTGEERIWNGSEWVPR
jgi:hypothetical protein